MVRGKDKALTIVLMEIYTRDNGWAMSNMDTDYRNMQMGTGMKGSG